MKAACKLFGVAAVVASAVLGSAVGASADPPSKVPFDYQDTYTVTDLCDFPFQGTSHLSGFDTFFIGAEEDGNDRVVFHATLQDTYTANGNTLVGDPYRVTGTFQFVEGELVAYTVVGVIVKVRLPDGSIFLGAGRTDFLATTVDFVVDPDHGVAKTNEDAFCAALSA